MVLFIVEGSLILVWLNIVKLFNVILKMIIVNVGMLRKMIMVVLISKFKVILIGWNCRFVVVFIWLFVWCIWWKCYNNGMVWNRWCC